MSLVEICWFFLVGFLILISNVLVMCELYNKLYERVIIVC